MLTAIRLGGHLGRKFGREWQLDLDVPSPAEAVRALSAICKGFRAWVLEHSRPGYHVFVGRQSIKDAKNLGIPTGSSEIIIMPALAGAKSGGLLGIIAGGILIAAGVVVGLYTGWTGAGLVIAKGAIGLGLSMALGGAAQLLSGQPPSADPEAKKELNYTFSGPVNTSGAGHPVPVIYGTLEVGSQVISAGISTRSVAAPNPVAYDDPSPYAPPSGWHAPKPIDP